MRPKGQIGAAVLNKPTPLRDDLPELFADVCLADLEKVPTVGGLAEVLAAMLATKETKSTDITMRNMTPEDRPKFWEAAAKEWRQLIEEKKAIRIRPPKFAQELRAKYKGRIMGSRYVYTKRLDDNNEEECKTRWCVRGDQDPDAIDMAFNWACSSPTMSVAAKALILQITAPFHWRLQLGDIEGAFLESGPPQGPAGRLICELPAGGDPDIEPGSLIELLLPVYGLGDAPGR